MKTALFAVLAALTITSFPPVSAWAAPCPVFEGTMTDIEKALDSYEASHPRRVEPRTGAPYTPAQVLVVGRKSHPTDL